ncbi:unnamed protein product, partial [Didymodactylos carnosus]
VYNMEEKLEQVYLIGKENIFIEFNQFKNEIIQMLDSHNIFGLITDNKKYLEAQRCYNKIIDEFPDNAEIAHYYKAYCIINLEGGERDGKFKVKKHLKSSLKLLETRRNTKQT